MSISKRSALGLVRTSVGDQTVWALVGEASFRHMTTACITTLDLEALPVDRTEVDRHVADVMSALETHSSRRAETPGGASWLYVQHVPVRRLITQLVRKLLALSAWPEFAAAPGPVTLAPYEGLLGLRDSSSREYRAYTVTWSGVAYALGAPAPYNPERSARLRKLTTLRPDSRLAGTPTPSAVPASEVVALSWSSRHVQTLLPVLEELASEGRSSVLVDLATDPVELCPTPAHSSITLHPGPSEALAASGTVPGLRRDAEAPAGTDGVVQVGAHTVRLDRLERLAAALLEGSGGGCTQPSWRAVVRVEEWLQELLDAVRPHTVLLSNDTSPLGALVAHAAERHGATTVNVQHGAWIPESVAWPALHSRHVVVMGDRDVAPARSWVRHPKAEIHVLGQPRFDALAGLGREAQRRYLQKLLGADSERGPERIAVWACQSGGFAGPGGHDRQDHVLPRGADLRLARHEGAQQDAAVVGIGVLGLGAFQAGTQADGLCGDLPGQQRGQLAPGGQPRRAAAEAQPHLRSYDGGGQEDEGGQDVAASDHGGLRQMRPDPLRMKKRLFRSVGGPRIGADNDVGEIAEQPGQRTSSHAEPSEGNEEVKEDVGAGGGRGRGGAWR